IGKHTSELQSPCNLVCRLLLEKKKIEERIISRLVYKKRIVETAGQKQRMAPRRPFAVIAEEQVRFLPFGHSQTVTVLALIIILIEVARMKVRVFHLKENAVLPCNLLLEPQRKV